MITLPSPRPFTIFLVPGVTIIVFDESIFFHPRNFLDYLPVSIISLLFFLFVIIRQSYGRIMGILTRDYYPAVLMVRVWYFR